MDNNQEFNIPQADESAQTPAFRYASFQHRLGGYALDIALAVVTLGIGWIIWSLAVWGEGQTPAKKILKMRTLHAVTGQPVTWGHMGVREFLIPLTVNLASLLSSGVVWFAWVALEITFYYTKGKRTFRDYWAKTVVVNEA